VAGSITVAGSGDTAGRSAVAGSGEVAGNGDAAVLRHQCSVCATLLSQQGSAFAAFQVYPWDKAWVAQYTRLCPLSSNQDSTLAIKFSVFSSFGQVLSFIVMFIFVSVFALKFNTRNN